MTDPVLLRLVCQEIAGRFPSEIVAGVAVGGVPLAVGVSLIGKRPYAIIRSVEKTHGKSGSLIGDVKGRNVILVEDVTTSGGSALYGVKALREAGATISAVVTVVDREQGATAALAKDNVTLHALVKASEITRE
jgi:orotate phosphoribosyltransferase